MDTQWANGLEMIQDIQILQLDSLKLTVFVFCPWKSNGLVGGDEYIIISIHGAPFRPIFKGFYLPFVSGSVEKAVRFVENSPICGGSLCAEMAKCEKVPRDVASDSTSLGTTGIKNKVFNGISSVCCRNTFHTSNQHPNQKNQPTHQTIPPGK